MLDGILTFALRATLTQVFHLLYTAFPSCIPIGRKFVILSCTCSRTYAYAKRQLGGYRQG